MALKISRDRAEARKGLCLTPDFAGAHHDRAILSANRNRHQEAILHGGEALRLGPGLEDLRVNPAAAPKERSRSSIP